MSRRCKLQTGMLFNALKNIYIIHEILYILFFIYFIVSELELTHSVTIAEKARQIPDAVYTVLSS